MQLARAHAVLKGFGDPIKAEGCSPEITLRLTKSKSKLLQAK